MSKSQSSLKPRVLTPKEKAKLRELFYNRHIVRPKANWAGIFIVALILVLLAMAIVAMVEFIGAGKQDPEMKYYALSADDACSSPSSGTIDSTPGRSFFLTARNHYPQISQISQTGIIQTRLTGLNSSTLYNPLNDREIGAMASRSPHCPPANASAVRVLLSFIEAGGRANRHAPTFLTEGVACIG